MIEITYPESECCCACNYQAEIKVKSSKHGNSLLLCEKCKILLAKALILTNEEPENENNIN